MQLSPYQALITILAVSAGVMVTRFLPFILFRGEKKMSPKFENLKELIPPAMMGLLVVYCLKDVSFTSPPYGIAEIVSVVTVILLHQWKRNSLLSIFGGVAVYMTFLQFILK